MYFYFRNNRGIVHWRTRSWWVTYLKVWVCSKKPGSHWLPNIFYNYRFAGSINIIITFSWSTFLFLPFRFLACNCILFHCQACSQTWDVCIPLGFVSPKSGLWAILMTCTEKTFLEVLYLNPTLKQDIETNNKIIHYFCPRKWKTDSSTIAVVGVFTWSRLYMGIFTPFKRRWNSTATSLDISITALAIILQ